MADTTTTHYGWVQPQVGGSLNTWGNKWNNNLSSIDTTIYAVSAGINAGVNAPAASASNITLTNPLVNAQMINFTGPNLKVFLPAMNAASSAQAGAVLLFKNVGSYPFAILAQDTSTSVLSSLPIGASAEITVLTNATANGTFAAAIRGDLYSQNNLSDVANAATALNNLLPSQASAAGQFLTSNGTNASWASIQIYPVGSLYFNVTSSTNPASLLGYGTWVAWGQGRIPIGVGTGTDVNGSTLTVSANTTGGEYQHTLITNEMPSHLHGVNDPTHMHNSSVGFSDKGGSGNGYCYSDNQGGSTIHGYGNPGGGTQYSSTGISIQYTGGGSSHNNIQPWIAVYIWQRTA